MNGPFENLKILLADVSDYFRELIRLMLQEFGITEITEARNGKEAFERLKTKAVDIAIIEYRLGKIDGLAFTRKVRNDPGSPNKFLPIMMLTSCSERSHAQPGGICRPLHAPGRENHENQGWVRVRLPKSFPVRRLTT